MKSPPPDLPPRREERLTRNITTKEMKTNKPSFINLLPPRGEVGRGAIWLFLELVVITVVAWVVFDPAIVNLYHRCLPLFQALPQTHPVQELL